LIGISTTYFALQGFGLYDSVAQANKAGFGLAELGAAHAFEKNIPSALKKIKNDFSKMRFTVHGLFPPLKKGFWFNPPEGLTVQNKKVIEGFFSAAVAVEAELVSFHPGFSHRAVWGRQIRGLNYPSYGKQFPRARAFENSFKVFSFAQKLSEKTGINFAIENIPVGGTDKPLFVTAKDFEKAFSLFSSCGLLLDYGHALFSQNLQELLSLQEKIKQIHLHYSKPFGKANIDDNHAPVQSLETLAPLLKVKQLRRIPVIFEHGNNVPLQSVLREKQLFESFLEKNAEVFL